jgi:hypothetical protein
MHKLTNAEWIENTNLTLEDLKCKNCDAEVEIYHNSSRYTHGLFYAICRSCKKEQNISWKKADAEIPKDNSMNENSCSTCKHIDKDGQYPCNKCGDVYPYDMFQKKSN